MYVYMYDKELYKGDKLLLPLRQYLQENTDYLANQHVLANQVSLRLEGGFDERSETWGNTLMRCINENMDSIRIAPEEQPFNNEDYERFDIISTDTNEMIGHLFVITLHFRDSLYDPRCTVWTADREDLSLYPAIGI